MMCYVCSGPLSELWTDASLRSAERDHEWRQRASDGHGSQRHQGGSISANGGLKECELSGIGSDQL